MSANTKVAAEVVKPPSGCVRARDLLVDVEAEHHAALVVLGDMAVSHPAAGIGDVEQDLDRLLGSHQHRVLPHEVGLRDAVAAQYQEPACAMDMERMVHGMVPGHLVDQSDLDLVPEPEPPIDSRVFCASFTVDELPTHVGGCGHSIYLDHVVFPLDAADCRMGVGPMAVVFMLVVVA